MFIGENYVDKYFSEPDIYLDDIVYTSYPCGQDGADRLTTTTTTPTHLTSAGVVATGTFTTEVPTSSSVESGDLVRSTDWRWEPPS